jgi:hypothetical protein
MKFLALEREKPGLNAQDFAPHGKAEARRAWELYTQGVFRAMYFNSEAHTAILILEALDKAAAQAALDTLPMVQAGLITFDLIPLSQSSLVFSETIVGNSLKCDKRSLRTVDFRLSYFQLR